jgi:hypothetical protein
MVSPVTKEITLSDQPRRLEKLQDGGQPRSKQYEVKFFDCNNWRMTPAEKTGERSKPVFASVS